MLLFSRTSKFMARTVSAGCPGGPPGRRFQAALFVGLLLWIQPAQAALRLKVRFGEFERSVAVADFAQYAETGQAPPGLAWYLNRMNSADRAALRKALSLSLIHI